MLSIRMKRLGRKGHPTYRVVVQDSRQSPSSGKYVALLGSYDPHTKQSSLVKDKAEFYLKNGAQPSDRVAALFKTEKITLPKWVEKPVKKKKQLRNPDKLRKNRPADSTPADKPAAEEKPEETASAEENNSAADNNTEQTAEAGDKTAQTDTSEKAPEPESEQEGPSDEAKQTDDKDPKQEDSADESPDENKA